MTSSSMFRNAAILLTTILLFGTGAQCHAQATPSSPPVDEYLISISVPNPAVTPDPMTAHQPVAAAAADPSPSGSPQVGLPPEDTGWHFSVSPYLWFPGLHGTIGARGHDASIHVSPGDLLSHFRFGLMGLVDTRYKRIVIPVDMMWIRLGANNALPLTDEAVTAHVKGSEFILTPKIGYRLFNSEIVKIDALTGFRYWHFGANLRLSTSETSTQTFSGSENWVDPLVGGRILANLSPKVSVSIVGDVGGWNTGSLLDYQVGAILGYRVKPAVVLQAGYRYLAVDYRSEGTTINTVTSGALFGATITLK